jgi:predicted hydrocarbon binding protein
MNLPDDDLGIDCVPCVHCGTVIIAGEPLHYGEDGFFCATCAKVTDREVNFKIHKCTEH